MFVSVCVTCSDAILVSIMDCLTSVFAGLVIFAIIGYMAHELHVKVEDVATEGQGRGREELNMAA